MPSSTTGPEIRVHFIRAGVLDTDSRLSDVHGSNEKVAVEIPDSISESIPIL